MYLGLIDEKTVELSAERVSVDFDRNDEESKDDPKKRKSLKGRKKKDTLQSQLEAISKYTLGSQIHTPLGRAQHKMNQWSFATGPVERKDEIKEGFRIELANHLDDLRDAHKRTRDLTIKELCAIADDSDLISAALIKVSEPLFDDNQMHDLVIYVHDKYMRLPKDFNFTAFTSKNLNVEKFYRLYSEKVALKNKNIGWHPALLKHAVHLDVVHIFASLAH